MVAEETPIPVRPDPLARRPLRIALAVLLIVGALGSIESMRRMGPLDAPLRQARADEQAPPITPHGIVDWELAFSASNAKEILRVWGDPVDGTDLLPMARQSLRLDAWLIASYFLALTALCLLVARMFPPGQRGTWRLVTALPAMAAVLDVAENLLLKKQLEGVYDYVLWASLAATAKFSLLVSIFVALICVGTVWLRKRQSVPRSRPAHPLSDVEAAERQYLQQRRKLAGLSQRRQPTGLALSGGGSRSATINLGVLQALARRRVLPGFDYLSTVSGGGYIGAALSSLLSINGSGLAQSRQGAEGQYLFDQGDRSWFSTDHDRFPFNEDNEGALRAEGGFGGRSQLRHLRAAGDFLVGKRQPIEMLRVVGGVLGGILYHLLHFGLFMVFLSAGYLWIIYLMVGRWATRTPPADPLPPPARSVESATLFEKYAEYVKQAFGLRYEGEWWTHPFFIAAVTGFAALALILVLGHSLLKNLPDDLFSRPGNTLARSRNEDGVLATVASGFVLGFVLPIAWFATEHWDNLLNISIPLFFFLGGGVCLAIGDGLVRMSRRSGRPLRSRLAAQEGTFVYVTLVSLFLVLFMLPFLVFFDPLAAYLSERPLRSLFGWLLTVLGAQLLARGGEEEAAGRGLLGRLLGMFPGLRKVLFSVVVVLAVLGGLLLICTVIWRFPQESPGWFRLAVCLSALVLFLLTGWLDFNRLSLHFFYRDRLAEAYLQTMKGEPNATYALRPLRDNEALRLDRMHGRKLDGEFGDCVTSAPYHLLVTCLNLAADKRPKQATRKTDQFIFSKLFCGSEATGYRETGLYRAGHTSLADAMTISGAAASPAMGSRTFFGQSAAMTLFNVRLGQWMENPGFEDGKPPRTTFWPPYLLREVLASCDADHRLVYLSDGGHSGDNLGIYPLLKRRCGLILAIDAEHDPLYSGNSLVEALRQIQIDEGITVDIDLARLRPGRQSGQSTEHFVSGQIFYPRRETSAGTIAASTGWLIVIKSSLTGDEPEMIANYKRGNDPFPHQSTGDLFFDDAQFEAYRQLGEHMVDTMLDTSTICQSELQPAPRAR